MGDDALDEAALARLREELLRHRAFLRAEMESQGADPDSDDVAWGSCGSRCCRSTGVALQAPSGD